LPTLWAAAATYFAPQVARAAPFDPAEGQQLRQNYYIFPLSSIPYLVAPIWLLFITGLATLVGLFTRNTLIYIQLIWAVLLVLVGNLYLLNVPALNFTNLGAVLIMLYIPMSIIIGAGFVEVLRRLPRKYLRPVRVILIASILAAALPATFLRATTVESYRHFVSEQDMVAMQWIDKNVPADATFAINTYKWLPRFFHGTDAGYWIPYFTQREIVTTAMLSTGLSREYRDHIQARSEAAEALETDLSALSTLHNLGVEYIYIGANGDFSGPGLRVDYLTQSDAVQLLYGQGGTAILKILPTDTQ
jgi:hypothetical protein